MNKTYPTASAFGFCGMDTTNGTGSDGDRFHETIGLTKREYFTAAALQGLAAAGSACMPNWDELARMAVELADYTIVALNKQTTGG